MGLLDRLKSKPDAQLPPPLPAATEQPQRDDPPREKVEVRTEDVGPMPAGIVERTPPEMPSAATTSEVQAMAERGFAYGEGQQTHTDAAEPTAALYILEAFFHDFVPTGAAGEPMHQVGWDRITEIIYQPIGKDKMMAAGAAQRQLCWTLTKDASGLLIEAGMNASDPNKIGYIITKNPWNHLDDIVRG